MPRQAAQPHCHIIPGPNGPGNTAFAIGFLTLYVDRPNFINPNLMTQEL